jgi:hypothetical protein
MRCPFGSAGGLPSDTAAAHPGTRPVIGLPGGASGCAFAQHNSSVVVVTVTTVAVKTVATVVAAIPAMMAR